ncbi:MAG TPA: hypothetical protein PLK10_09180 [Ottowia sp.]|nr:hypothetical protein [Ottowia sp.]
MTMIVDPGGSYFGLYSNFGDVFRGEAVSYADAVASAAAAGARDVTDLVVPDDIGAPTVLSGHPKVIWFDGDGSNLAVNMTYDNGYWGDGDGEDFLPSNFLVEIQGPAAGSFVVDSGGGSFDFSINHYVSSDGGQSIYLESQIGELLTGVTRIKVWRAVVFPGDPLPEPPQAFWTGFLGAIEAV